MNPKCPLCKNKTTSSVFGKHWWVCQKCNLDIPKTIKTADGEKKYYKTEVDSTSGKWNDNYYIKDGFWVIHQAIGNEGRHIHHIYK